MKVIYRKIKQIFWALIVAFMVGIHNFYKEQTRFPDDIVLIQEEDSEEKDSAPKD